MSCTSKKHDKKNGRIYLSIVDGYYDKEKGHARTVTIEKVGYLDELEKQYEDPIAYFKQRVQELKQKKVEQTAPVSVTFSHDEKLTSDHFYRKNFGYAVLNRIYHELEIDRFLTSKQRGSKIGFSSNDIMKLLVFSRLLYPASKKKTFENRSLYFEKHNYSLDDVYRSLSFFDKHRSALQVQLNDRIKKLYGRRTDLVYYDVTNYYPSSTVTR